MSDHEQLDQVEQYRSAPKCRLSEKASGLNSSHTDNAAQCNIYRQ